MPPKKTTKSTPKRTTSQTSPRPTPSRPQTSVWSEDLHAQIAKRAYDIFQRRIRQGALDDWLQAEREILQLRSGYPEAPPHRGGYAGPEQE
jgi:DUF2934 family protein